MKTYEISVNSNEYPKELKLITDPPKQLFWSGKPIQEFLDLPRVAVVGSRKLSSYGRQVTTELVQGLVAHGVAIVSGLALGIDAVAHRSALEAGGVTVAVLPTELSNIYPAHNTLLARQILQGGGALTTEYVQGSPFVYKYNFIARNRIIAALSQAVLITEAAADSGSLHTADFALQQGRDVMVVPGNITSSTSAGTNNLLKVGAVPVTSLRDILDVLNINQSTSQTVRGGASAPEQCILNLLADGCHDGEQLLVRSGLLAAEFNQALTLLEINGYIKAAGCNTWY